MQRYVILIILVLSTGFCAASADPIADDIRQHPECKYCGMDRQKFRYSRMLVRYDDGTVVPTCSIHCTGIELALSPHKGVAHLLVGDYDTGVLLDAEKAFWVLGGDKMGVMSIRGKWAFAGRKGAAAFITQHGGRLSSLGDLWKATFEDMYEILRPICRECPDRFKH